MTSPNEPGHPGPGESSGDADGAADHGSGNRSGRAPVTGRITDVGDVPPWQRGAPRPRQAPHRPPPANEEPRPSGHSAGVEARLSRFVAGTSAPGAGQPAHSTQAKPPVHESESAPARDEGPTADAYASELPDLSGPRPRPAQPKPAPDRGADGSTKRDPDRSAGAGSRVRAPRPARGPVRANMQIRRIDPWSVLKVSLLLSIALFFVWMIAVAFLYLVLGGMGVWSKLNSNVGDLLTNTSGGGELVSSSSIFGGAVLIGLVNIVLLTVMATLGAFIYNLTTDLIGGVEVTLADRE
ncbi:MAG: DUF3566 domain-containing protein [Actinomycetes bacterium]